MYSFKFTGFILGSKEWQEKDKLISVLTKEKGKIKLLAKGVRNPRSKRVGNLETGNLIRGIAFVNDKNNIPILGEIKLILQPLSKRKNLVYTTLLLYISELIDKLVVESQGEKKIFEFYKKTLFKLTKTNNIESAVRFSVELPNLLGFGISKTAKQFLEKGKIKDAQKAAERYIENISEKRITSLQLIRK